MNRFAELLDRLSYEPGRNNKLRLMTDYFRHASDPERGFALAALTGSLSFQYAKAGLIRTLIAERADPVLFGLSYDYVGDLSETVALLWPTPPEQKPNYIPSLSEVVTTLSTLGKSQLPAQLARWLDALDETGRWALLKLVTGGLRIGVSARLAKTAAAALGDKDVTDIELLWAGLTPPYAELFAWLEGRAERPVIRDPAPFRPAMLAHAVEDTDFAALDAADFMAEWKWDGIRVQAVAGTDGEGARDTALFAHRRRHHQKLPRPCGRIPARRRHRWRTPDPARRARAILQCPAAAAKPQNRHAEAACRIPCASARLRSSRRWHGGLARSSVCRAAQMPGSVRDQARRSARRSLAHDRIQVLGRIESRAYRSVLRRRRRRCRRRRHAQAARFDLRARPPARAVVEMEARSVRRRCGADVCAARARQALVLLFRLHIRRLEGGRRRRRACARRQGLFRLHRRGIAENRPLRPEKHRRPFRPGAGSHPRARRRPGVRSRLRGSGALNEA